MFLTPTKKKKNLRADLTGALFRFIDAIITGLLPRAKWFPGLREEIRSLMALSPGRKAITRSNESTIVGNRLMKETSNDSSDTIA